MNKVENHSFNPVPKCNMSGVGEKKSKYSKIDVVPAFHDRFYWMWIELYELNPYHKFIFIILK